MNHRLFQIYTLKLLSILLLSGCATATFYARDSADDPPVEMEESSKVKQVNAELGVTEIEDEVIVQVPTEVPLPADEVERETIQKKEQLEQKTWFDYLSGRNVAADIPYAKELPWVGAPAPSERVAENYLNHANSLFAAKKYVEARTQYEEAADRFPDSPIEEESLFKIAECYFFSDKYPESFEAYEALLVNYKRSRYLDTAVSRQFAIGRYWQKRYEKDPEGILTPNLVDKTRPFNDLQGSALRAFEKVRLNHPTGPLADDSLMATATAKFLRRYYEDADYYYGLVRQEYPDSEHQYQAHVLGIQAKIRRYQGPRYEGICLQEAKELIEQTMRQFGQISEKDRSRLQKLHAQVSSNLALRDIEVAKFYEAKGFNGAARSYYDRVLQEFPHTQEAEKAGNQIERIQDAPRNPAPRMIWLSSLFPETREDPLVLEDAPEESELGE